jgi:hypothetical protein
VKVTNTGTLAATNVYLNWTVPSGWTINEGDFNTTIASLGVDKTSWNNITVDIGSSAATGSVTISAESNSTEAVYASDSKSVDVAAAAVVAGAGAVGGGGGGGVGGGGKATVSFKTIEIVRGEEDSFDIEVYNRAKDKILEHVVVDVTGFLSQYITISPEEIRRINPGDRKNFTVKINVPAYTEDAEEYDLKILINGELTSVGADLREQYRETQNIKLIILEVSDERVGLSDAERAVEEMRDAGFCVTNVEVLLEQARENLEERNNKGAQDLVREIVAIRDMAFSTEDLMGKILEALENPRKMNLITGNVAREVIDEDGEMVSVNSIIMGNAIFDSKDAEEVLELARVAFDRCDYDLAEERAKSAQVLLILERKGNLPLFIYLNWWAILLGIGAFSTAGIVGYRRYQKSAVTKRIDSINKKEENVRRLIVGAQRSYFSGKISAGVYHGRMRNHQRELARLRKVRLRLRNKRIKIYEASSDFPGVGS